MNSSSSGPGDFRYTGSAQSIQDFANGFNENGMFPADFDGDGDQDIFFANYGQGSNLRDAILINTGNAANGFANFSAQQFAPTVNTETHKVSRTDLDGDGKIDLVVMDNQSSPRIYRNISTPDNVAFVLWTEAMFTSQHDGWHANSADVTGNGRADLLVGATNDDFLFENSPAAVVSLDSLTGGVVPNFHNSSPVAISGAVDGGATLSLTVNGGSGGVPSGSTLSIIARSDADIDIVLMNGATTVASSARLDAVHEGIQYNTTSSNDLNLEITNNSAGTLLGDINGDSVFNLLDVSPFVDLLGAGGFNPAADFNGDGAVNLLDVQGFVDALGNGSSGTTASPFVVEFLSN